MSLQYIANSQLMTVSLLNPYVAASGTMTLAAGQGAFLPPTGDFWIRQASVLNSSLINILKVTARAGDVLTVVGGQDGTIDQGIAAGVSMVWTLCYSALTQLRLDILAQQVVGTYQPTQRIAGVASTNLATGLAAGVYQVLSYFQVSSTNASPLFLDCELAWVFNGVARTTNIINSMNLGVADLAIDDASVIRVDAASTVSFTITIGAGTFGYLPSIILVKVG